MLQNVTIENISSASTVIDHNHYLMASKNQFWPGNFENFKFKIIDSLVVYDKIKMPVKKKGRNPWLLLINNKSEIMKPQKP